MIRQWVIVHYPSERDALRYRLSLQAEGGDVARIRGLFPSRVGAVWVPRRKPYNCAFFLYNLSDQEKDDLVEILSGKEPFPAAPAPFLPARQARPGAKKEDTQEILIREALSLTGKERVIPVGYFVPEHLPDADARAHEILERTLVEKRISVTLENRFRLRYRSLSLKEIKQLMQKCQEQAVTCVIAVGEPALMAGLKKVGKDAGVLVRPLPESVLDRNLWLSMIAEILSFE